MNDTTEIGIDTEKRWLSFMTDKAINDHAMVTGETVDYNEEFSNGLMFPGDPNGEVEQIINWRCVLQ